MQEHRPGGQTKAKRSAHGHDCLGMVVQAFARARRRFDPEKRRRSAAVGGGVGEAPTRYRGFEAQHS